MQGQANPHLMVKYVFVWLEDMLHWAKGSFCGGVTTRDGMGATFGALGSKASNTRSDHGHSGSGMTDGICNFSWAKHWQTSLEPRDSSSQINKEHQNSPMSNLLSFTMWHSKQNSLEPGLLSLHFSITVYPMLTRQVEAYLQHCPAELRLLTMN